MLKRFRRRFRKIRRRTKFGSNSKKLQNKVRFTLAELRDAKFVYGQQHTSPNSSVYPECVYFTVEQTDITHTTRDQTLTKPLYHISDVLDIANHAWIVGPNNPVTGTNLGWVADISWGHLYLKGRDKYYIRNQSNEQVILTAYYCVGRHNSMFNLSTNSNVYNWLGAGFAENGYDPTNAWGQNGGLVVDALTPFQSRMFVRQNKIYKVKQFRINPGKQLVKSLSGPWRRFTPADLTTNPGNTAAGSWTNRNLKFTNLRGEKFILWKMSGNLAGITGQSTLEKNVTETTPTIIMKTIRTYKYKHQPVTQAPLTNFTPYGYTNTGTRAIMIDTELDAGDEKDAS